MQARSSKVINVAVIALVVLISQSLVLVQAMSDPAAEANIHASSFTSKFAYEINPGRYYTDPDTKNGYYLIGSTYPGFEHTTPDEPTPTVVNKTLMVQPASNMTAITPISRIEPTQPAMNINKTISNAYKELFMVINNKIKYFQQIPRKNIEENNEGYTSGIHVPMPSQAVGNTNAGEELKQGDPAETMSHVFGQFPKII